MIIHIPIYNTLQKILNTISIQKGASKLGGWMEGVTPDAEVQDFVLEDVEDVSKSKSVGPATPLTPHASSGIKA